MRQQTYSVLFKENLLKKVFQPNAPAISFIAKKANIPVDTLYSWVSKERKKGVEVSRKTKKIGSKLKLEAIMKLASLPEQELGRYLRENGLHKQQVEGWRDDVDEFLASRLKSNKNEKNDPDKVKIKQLEADLRRKEKALAEASALLILKKKASLIWGDEED